MEFEMNLYKPYTKLATVYDQIMDHVNYKEWAVYVHQLIKTMPVSVEKIVDLSCGTGSFLSYFVNEGIDGYGADLSPEMLSLAIQKNSKNHFRFFAGSITDIPLKSSNYDVVLILYDSINYLLIADELTKMFLEVHRILRQNGVLIFDTITQLHCIEHHGDFSESVYWENLGYERKSYFNLEKQLQITDFEILQGDQKYREHHIQRVYDVNFLKDLVISNGFQCNLFDEFSMKRATSKSKRVHFLCLRKELES
jgi:ubiquinone/menaquinone biosynthesis C-methylase UbiE